MAFKINFSQQAANDLDEIIEYISDELYNPTAAERFYNKVNEKKDLLRDNPYIFPLYHDEKLSAEGYRAAIVGNYLMFYIIDNEKSVINIVRILYGKRDILSVISE